MGISEGFMPTNTENQIAALQAQLQELQIQKTQEDAFIASPGTENLRELAVALHAMFCRERHPSSVCRWTEVETPDNPNSPLIKWVSGDHGKWLAIAKSSIAQARAIGFVITDPDEV
jgi:hypothetical protein